MKWSFLNTGLCCGTFNMQFDEYLAKRMLEGRGGPTVRVYGWKPYAISLGFHQDARDLDRDRCRAEGIDVVRRPTGGRAILHAHEATYSVVMYSDGRSIMDVYADIGRALVRSLECLGVTADLSPPATDRGEVHEVGVACFAAASRYEVQVHGRKIVGSAQRRYAATEPGRGSVVLQHGSVLLGPQHRALVDYVVADPRKRGIMRAVLEGRTTDVETILGRPVSFEETAEALKTGFEQAWDASMDEVESRTHSGLPAYA